MDRKQTLATAFSSIKNRIEFNAQWANGTGYFDNGVKGPSAPVLIPGETASSVDTHGRKIVFIGTRLGNVVVFEREATSGDVPARVVCNAPRELEYLFETNMSSGDIHRAVNPYMNIGLWLEGIHTKFCY